MARPTKDAFLAPPPKVEVEEGVSAPRETKNWGRRLYVDGVEVNPETMEPLNPTEE